MQYHFQCSLILCVHSDSHLVSFFFCQTIFFNISCSVVLLAMNFFNFCIPKEVFILPSFYFKFIYLFIFGCVGPLLLHAGFFQSRHAEATLCCGARASHCSGFSCCGAQALSTWASVVEARGLSSCGLWALEHRLSSCGSQAQLLCSTWDLPGPRIEPMSPAFASRFLTTVPQGKSHYLHFKTILSLVVELQIDRFFQYFKDNASLSFHLHCFQ